MKNTVKQFLNQKGLTLIELLAAITIIGIILIGFVTFFAQSINFSVKVEDNLSSVNIAEKFLYEVKSNNQVISALQSGNEYACDTNPFTVSGTDLALTIDSDYNDYFYEVNNNGYYPDVTICRNTEEKNLDLYRVHVAVFVYENQNKQLASEVHGYINMRDYP